MLKLSCLILFLGLSLTAAVELKDTFVNGSKARTCYSCKGINCQIISRQDDTVECNDLLDVCVTVFDGFRVSEKGCLLELSLAGQSKCDAQDKQCRMCSGEKCNNQGRIDFKCIQCNGSQDSKCNQAGDAIIPSQCPAPTSSNAYCYVKAVNNQLQRGCALGVKEQKNCLEDAQCSLCLPENAHHSSACNNYQLEVKSGAARSQQLVGLLLGMLGLLTVKGLH